MVAMKRKWFEVLSPGPAKDYSLEMLIKHTFTEYKTDFQPLNFIIQGCNIPTQRQVILYKT